MTATYRRSRKLPFLHRNWIKATNHWDAAMGNKSSAQSREGIVSREDEPGRRAAKRRRLDNDYDGFPLFEDYANTTRALRIEVLKIFHKDSMRFKNGPMNSLVALDYKAIAHVKARCKITLSSRQAGQPVVLHVDSQVCDLSMFKHPANNSPIVRFSSFKPFTIPEDKIYIQRDDDAVFGLADMYTVLIELESAGDPNWPPLDLVSISEEDAFYDRSPPARQWVLMAGIPNILSTRIRNEIPIVIKKQTLADAATNFRMDVDVRWLTPISSQLVGRLHDKDIQPSITVFGIHEPIPAPITNGHVGSIDIINGLNGVNGINGMNGVNGFHLHQEPSVNGAEKLLNGHVTDISVDQADELAEGETTPNRPQRARPAVNYNDRENMAKQLGKQPRKRRRQDEENGPQVDEHTITYLLPPEQVQTERFGCLICGAENDRLSQLRAHYMSHPQYEFNFEVRPKAGCVVTVTPTAGDGAVPLRPRVYQLGLPVKPLDLERYVDGDNSWVNSRLGPDDGRDILAKFPHVKAQQKLAPRRVKKKVLVPNIKQPLFDPRSKVQLAPGTEIRQQPIDDTWLLRKHRDNLADFLDVNPQEKEYMQEWDSFLLKKHISSQHFLPRAFLGFVKEKAPWIVAKKRRCEEFGKHCSLLLARCAINEANIVEATQRLNEARGMRTEEAPQQQKPQGKSASGCVICGEPVPVPVMLLCSNKSCNARLYHVSCVKNGEELVKNRAWRCGKCT